MHCYPQTAMGWLMGGGSHEQYVQQHRQQLPLIFSCKLLGSAKCAMSLENPLLPCHVSFPAKNISKMALAGQCIGVRPTL